MAKRTYQINMPAEAQSNAFPAGLRQQLETSLPYYQNQATATSYYEEHPYKAMLRGVLGGAGINALFMPGMVEQAANQRRAKAVQDYNAFYQNAIAGQKAIDDRMADRNVLQARQTQMDAIRNSKHDENGNPIGLPAGTPDLYPRSLPPMGSEGQPFQQNIPYIPAAESEKLFHSAAAPSDISAQIQLMPQMAQSAIGVMNQPSGTNGQLQAGISNQQYNLPPVIADPTTLQNNLAEVFKTGLGQGTEKYKFDQQAPKRLAEVKKLLAEGNAAGALAVLRGKQAITEGQRPALVKAQTNQANASASLSNRTDPNLRGGSTNMLDQMSPEQKQAYLDKQAGLSNGPMSLQDSYQLAGLRATANQMDWSGKFTPEALVAQDTLRMLDWFTNSGAGPAPGGGNKPTKGGSGVRSTTVKGKHGTYSF